MLSSLRWLALEAKYLERAREFCEGHLDLPVVESGADEVIYAAGDHYLCLRRPAAVPRGGLHTHYALSTPDDRYDAWYERLSADFDLVEHRFGDARSLYLYDADGNCVEAGGEGSDVTGIFEVVLEVEGLDAAESFYADLGFETVDRGEDRRRVRMRGPMDLELWEPQLGIADARGGVHVDLGFEGEATGVVGAVEDRALAVEHADEGVCIRDPDGHRLTVT
jgi:catechol 2,3-dioxygenase-like lactoylglutathione lyase family enzyme